MIDLVVEEDGHDHEEPRQIEAEPKVPADRERDGWMRLGDLAMPGNPHFDTAPGHAVALLWLVDEARCSIGLVRHPGRYRPGKVTILSHMSEHRRLGRAVGRHLQAIKNAAHVQFARLCRRAREDLRASNPNPKGRMKEETHLCLRAMKHFVADAHRVAAAARNAAKLLGDGCTCEAARRAWYTYQGTEAFDRIDPLTAEEVENLRARPRKV